MSHIVLGTAGHIDHGKTALVRALTGIDTDRLKVEKERGITTELGFAHIEIDGQRFGFVDVPGHERFVRAMVAGATGLDMVCLVVAADEGVMPQTREHLDICHLLGVRAGLVALTKCDMVERDWIEMVSADLATALEGSFLEGAAIIPCSAKTGEGLDDIRRELARLAKTLEPRSATGTFRLPIDRAFTMKGFGTIVTGTIAAGTVRLGDDVAILPSAREGKVRGIQVHGESTEQARAGTRCALNLGGVATSDIRRGDVLAHPEDVAVSHILDVRLDYLATSIEPLRSRQRVLIHHGTTQVLGNITLLDKELLNPGESGLAQLRIDRETPLAAVPGDRFLLRGFVAQRHYGTTLGGGEIIRVQAAKLRAKDDVGDELAELANADERERLVHEVGRVAHRGLSRSELGQRLGLGSEALDRRVDAAAEAGDVVLAKHAEGAEVLVSPEAVAQLEKQAVDLVNAQGSDSRLPKGELREKLPHAMPHQLFELILSTLIRRGAVRMDDGDVVPGGAAKIAPLSDRERDLDARYLAWGTTPPRPAELAQNCELSAEQARQAAEALLRAGRIRKIKSDLYVHSAVIDDLRNELESHLDERGEITPAEWKAITGASRKYSIPLAEYFDQEKLTLRVGNVRKRRG